MSDDQRRPDDAAGQDAGGQDQAPEIEAPALPPALADLVVGARELLGDALLKVSMDVGGALVLEAEAARSHELLAWLKTEAQPAMSYLSDLHGADYGDTVQVVYHLFPPGEALEVTVKAVMDRDRPQVPTVMDLWVGAWWPEREVMEMFGIVVIKHPDPRKLLLPEDWRGHPLRKDYKYPLDHPWMSPEPLHENPHTGDAEKARQAKAERQAAKAKGGGD